MCRLFGFRSVINSQVHTSLIEAENALGHQSNYHPDGWGVSFYLKGSPHLIKSPGAAFGDSIFKKVSGVVSSQTVIAHIRKATLGENSILNTHPFQFGKWTFAHNGNIKDFEQLKPIILERIHPELRRFILGTTDSELFFFYLLTHLNQQNLIDTVHLDYNTLNKSVREAVEGLIKIIGEYSKIDNAGEQETYLTFILTNGEIMLAHQGGKHLNYSTYKKKCPDRDSCPSFGQSCEAPTTNGLINHLIFSSEPLSGENIWRPLKLGQIVGIDNGMKLTIEDR